MSLPTVDDMAHALRILDGCISARKVTEERQRANPKFPAHVAEETASNTADLVWVRDFIIYPLAAAMEAKARRAGGC